MSEDGPIVQDTSAIDLQVTRAAAQICTPEGWRQRYLFWTAVCHIPFSMCENSEFCEMILYSSPTLCGNDTMPQSGSTVKIWLVELFLKLQIIIISFLAKCDSMIHLSFDLWTALNNYSMLGIFYHFIDKNFKCHVVLLGMKRLYGAHSSENIAVLVIQTLQAYHLEKRLRFCVMDNTTDNDTSLATIEVFLFSIGVK